MGCIGNITSFEPVKVDGSGSIMTGEGTIGISMERWNELQDAEKVRQLRSQFLSGRCLELSNFLTI